MASSLLGAATSGLLNGVGLRPTMGWSSWNTLRCDISEENIREVAAAIVQTGLRDAGYRYINLDDCWQSSRGPDGHIVPSARFPSGIKRLADHLHSLGLKLGVYSDTGNVTCEGRPGSYGYEREDAQDYAAWGVDLLKYDYCGMENATRPTREYYERMHRALNATGRPMVFSICSWGVGSPHLWGARLGHSWRTATDLFAVWDAAHARDLRLPPLFGNVLDAVDRQASLAQHAEPGGYNDLDMLLVGVPAMTPYGKVASADRCPRHLNPKWCKPGQAVTREMWGAVGGLTQTEQRAHFSLWCVLASPLILGHDPRQMRAATLRILTAPELIAINQDPLGRQAHLTWSDERGAQIWRKDLADGSHALLVFNRGAAPRDITTRWERDFPTEARRWARQVAREPRCFDEHEPKHCAYEVSSKPSHATCTPILSVPTPVTSRPVLRLGRRGAARKSATSCCSACDRARRARPQRGNAVSRRPQACATPGSARRSATSRRCTRRATSSRTRRASSWCALGS